MTSFDKAMAEFANALVTKAKAPDTSLPDMIDAFKVLTPYFAALRKGKSNDIDEDNTSMGSLMDKIRAAEEKPNGASPPTVRSGGRGAN